MPERVSTPLALLKLEHGFLKYGGDDGERRFAACLAKGVCASQNGEIRYDFGHWQRGDASKDDLSLGKLYGQKALQLCLQWRYPFSQ